MADHLLSTSLDRIINQADLLTVLEKMTDGLQTELGEGGALVSGGEGNGCAWDEPCFVPMCVW